MEGQGPRRGPPLLRRRHDGARPDPRGGSTRASHAEECDSRSVPLHFREIINPLDWHYDREAQSVRIANYAKPIASRVIPVATLRPRIVAYGAKYGDWRDVGRDGPARGRRTLDGWYGILSDKLLPATRATMAHVGSHKADCVCGECTDYDRPELRPEWTETDIDPITRPL